MPQNQEKKTKTNKNQIKYKQKTETETMGKIKKKPLSKTVVKNHCRSVYKKPLPRKEINDDKQE